LKEEMRVSVLRTLADRMSALHQRPVLSTNSRD
jgi:hypothetical protein